MADRPHPLGSGSGGPGAVLPLRLVPAASCFVALPRAFAQRFLVDAVNGAGVRILELSWESLEGYVHRVAVGWSGTIARDAEGIDVPIEFARCIGLDEFVARSPQACVSVRVVDSVPSAPQVDVEPCTADDWELIQLHAGVMESEFLRQICVVNDRHVHPIWVHQNILIRIRVTLPAGMECARLTGNTEVIVAPKERKALNPNTSLDPEFYFAASAPLRVQQMPIEVEVPEGQVWIHPETLAALDGNRSHSATDLLAVAVWKTTPSDDEQSRLTAAADCGVGILKCSTVVGRGRVAVSPSLAVKLDIDPLSTLQIRALRLPGLEPTGLCVKVRPQSAVTAADVTDWVNRQTNARVVFDGVVIQLHNHTRIDEACVLEVTFDIPGSFAELEKQLDGVPPGCLVKYCVLAAHGAHSPASLDIKVEAATPPQLRQIDMLASMRQPPPSFEDSIRISARSSDSYKKIVQALQPIVFREFSAARVLLRVKPPGSSFIYGERGSGKTTVLKALAVDLERTAEALVTSVFVDCRTLRGLKMETVKARLSEAYAQASQRSPAVVFLDNLDAIVPEEEETSGQVNDQSRRIAEHLITLLHHARECSWKSTQEVNARIQQELKKLRSSLEFSNDEECAAAKGLIDQAGAAVQSKSVATVAAARTEASLHKILKTPGYFDKPIQILSPNAEERECIIRNVLYLKFQGSMKQSEAVEGLDPAIDFGHLSSLTEGFRLQDLSNVADRSLHQFYMRVSRSCDGERNHRLRQGDFTQALDGFQPTALVGVDLFKSSVHWRDVGGLTDVRNTLKDTLELPTRYAKLYDHTPIKLPAGMLLYGPPGCGKTLLASAVASECGLNFISVKGPEVLNKYIGASEQAIRDLFARAASAAPSVLFLDEFDSIAPRRGADNTGVTDRLVNQLLTFLDGVESRTGVYVLAATSRPDMIDPALLRPGRLDKSLYCGFPNESERFDILQAVGRHMDISDDAAEFMRTIASAPKCRMFSGADLQALMYSAQLELVHEKLTDPSNQSNVIQRHHLKTAFDNAKPSTSVKARCEYDAMYAAFSRSRKTDFSVAGADATADKAHLQHQRTALA